MGSFGKWFWHHVAGQDDPTTAPTLDPKIREQSHKLKNAAASLQGAAHRMKQEADAMKELVDLMHGDSGP